MYFKMKRISQLQWLTVAVVALLCGTVFATPPSDNRHRRAKARYFWIEGAKEQARGNVAEAYELYRYAAQIDTSYIEALQNASVASMFAMKEMDSTSLMVLKRYIAKYPGDIAESEQYAQLAMYARNYDEAIRVYKELLRQKPSRTNYLLSISTAQIYNMKFSNAADTLLTYCSQEGLTPDLANRILLLYLVEQDTVRARRFMDDVLNSHPGNADYLIVKAEFYHHVNEPDSVLDALLQAEQIEPNNGNAKIILANAYLDLGDSLAYDRKVYEALLCDNFELEQKMDIIADYVQPKISDGGALDKAEILFKSLEQQYPREPKVMSMTAAFYAAQKLWDKTRETMQLAIDMDPSNKAYWNQMLYYDNAASHYEDVEKDYNNALKYIDGPDTDMKTTLAISFTMRKKYTEALEIYELLLKDVDSTLNIVDTVDNRNLQNSLEYSDLIRVSSLYSLVGDSHIAQGDTLHGYTAYENSLYFNPENAMTMNNYAYNIALQADGDLAKASQLSAKSIQFEPENATFYDTFAWICYKQGDFDNARILQKKALDLAKPEDISFELYDHYADILLMCGMKDNAIEFWQKALELDPDNESLKAKIKQNK